MDFELMSRFPSSSVQQQTEVGYRRAHDHGHTQESGPYLLVFAHRPSPPRRLLPSSGLMASFISISMLGCPIRSNLAKVNAFVVCRQRFSSTSRHCVTRRAEGSIQAHEALILKKEGERSDTVARRISTNSSSETCWRSEMDCASGPQLTFISIKAIYRTRGSTPRSGLEFSSFSSRKEGSDANRRRGETDIPSS
ncbi:hypothetical protein BC629DRAFT_1149944 [Irpex lacteus]|nr:hypothetical protein BC629DRAFT_1149944 [Irpex lacteus]